MINLYLYTFIKRNALDKSLTEFVKHRQNRTSEEEAEINQDVTDAPYKKGAVTLPHYWFKAKGAFKLIM